VLNQRNMDRENMDRERNRENQHLRNVRNRQDRILEDRILVQLVPSGLGNPNQNLQNPERPAVPHESKSDRKVFIETTVSALSSAASPYFFKPIGPMSEKTRDFSVEVMALLRNNKNGGNFTSLQWKTYIDPIKAEIEEAFGSFDDLPLLYKPFEHQYIRLKDDGQSRNDYIFVSTLFA